jgi:hypothetical protein
MTHHPNGELALVALIKTIPGVPPGKVATTLPGDTSTWGTAGFVQVASVGGSPLLGQPLRAPVLSVSAWCVTPNSQKSPWGQAQALAELVFEALQADATYPVEPAMPAGYGAARVLSGWPISEPRKMPGSEAGYAHVQFDLSIRWVKL